MLEVRPNVVTNHFDSASPGVASFATIPYSLRQHKPRCFYWCVIWRNATRSTMLNPVFLKLVNPVPHMLSDCRSVSPDPNTSRYSGFHAGSIRICDGNDEERKCRQNGPVYCFNRQIKNGFWASGGKLGGRSENWTWKNPWKLNTFKGFSVAES